MRAYAGRLFIQCVLFHFTSLLAIAFPAALHTAVHASELHSAHPLYDIDLERYERILCSVSVHRAADSARFPSCSHFFGVRIDSQRPQENWFFIINIDLRSVGGENEG